MKLESYIHDIPDFPRPGVLFRDIGPLLANPTAFNHSIELAAEQVVEDNPTAILAIESRGFLFAAPLALKLNVPLILARKAGKLPGKCVTVQYGLEYGTATLDMQATALRPDDRVLVVDDVLATGGTAAAAEALIEMSNAQTASMLFLIELTYLKGRDSLECSRVRSLIQY